MKLYLYKTPDGYLAEMEEVHHIKGPDFDLMVPTLGAVVPGQDANYCHHLCVSALRGKDDRGADHWLEWITKTGIANKYYAISDEFPFNPDEIEIVEFVENEKN